MNESQDIVSAVYVYDESAGRVRGGGIASPIELGKWARISWEGRERGRERPNAKASERAASGRQAGRHRLSSAPLSF